MTDVKHLLDAATPLPWAVNECPGTAGGAKCWRVYGHQDIYHPETPGAEHGVSVADINSEAAEDKANAALVVFAVNALPDFEAAVETLERLVMAVDDQYHDVFERALFTRSAGILPDLLKARNDATAALYRLREKVPA